MLIFFSLFLSLAVWCWDCEICRPSCSGNVLSSTGCGSDRAALSWPSVPGAGLCACCHATKKCGVKSFEGKKKVEEYIFPDDIDGHKQLNITFPNMSCFFVSVLLIRRVYMVVSHLVFSDIFKVRIPWGMTWSNLTDMISTQLTPHTHFNLTGNVFLTSAKVLFLLFQLSNITNATKREVQE